MNKFDRLGFKAKLWNGKWLTAEMYSDHLQTFGMLWADGNVHMTMAKIDPETICLSTGLRDSDGNLIYENDLLEIEKPNGKEIEPVYYQELDTSFRVWLEEYTLGLRTLIEESKAFGLKVRVVGNKLDEK